MDFVATCSHCNCVIDKDHYFISDGEENWCSNSDKTTTIKTGFIINTENAYKCDFSFSTGTWI